MTCSYCRAPLAIEWQVTGLSLPWYVASISHAGNLWAGSGATREEALHHLALELASGLVHCHHHLGGDPPPAVDLVISV